MFEIDELIESVCEELSDYDSDLCTKVVALTLMVDDLHDLVNELYARLDAEQEHRMRSMLCAVDEKRRKLKHPNLLN